MGATARESVNYAMFWRSGLMGPQHKIAYRPEHRPFEFIVASVSAGGDTYLLTRIKAGEKVVGLFCTTDGLGASAGAGRTLQIGDAADDDRYMLATDFDVVNASGTLAYAGSGFVPTADTDVVAKMHATNAATVGKRVWGYLAVVPVA